MPSRFYGMLRNAFFHFKIIKIVTSVFFKYSYDFIVCKTYILEAS